MRRNCVVSLQRWALLYVVLCAARASAQELTPKSGALVAVDTGQTLWIAPVGGKMQVIALDDYVIPRKDGFWRVRLQFESLAPDRGFRASETELWAVPLSKGKNAVAWEEEVPTTEQQEGQTEEPQQSEPETDSEELHHQELHFLSPAYISFYAQRGEESETYSLLKISDGQLSEGSLRVSEEKPPIPEAARSRDVKACVDPKSEMSPDDLLAYTSEVSYGIVRGRGKWHYASMLGRIGYSTDCAVSVLPPKSLVAQSELFPGWKEIKDTYPDAEDAFSSPAHDLILIFYQNRLMVAPVQQGKIGKPLLRLEVNGKPVMVEWALGKYVDAWTNQLTPYFGVYQPKAKTSQ
jgi:hypothetical protein